MGGISRRSKAETDRADDKYFRSYFERMAGSRMVKRLVSYLLRNNTKCLVSGNDVISTRHFRDTRPHNEGDMGYFKKN